MNTVYRSSFKLGLDKEVKLETLVDKLHEWTRIRGIAVNRKLFEEDFSLNGISSLHTISIPDEKNPAFGFVLEHQDRTHPDVRWRVHTTIQGTDKPLVSVDVSYDARTRAGEEHVEHAAQRFRPQFVYDFIKSYGASTDGTPLHVLPFILENPLREGISTEEVQAIHGGIEHLAKNILSKRRSIPIVYMSTTLQNNLLIEDPARFADNFAGYATVIVASADEQSDLLNEHLKDQKLRVFGGAIGIYMPADATGKIFRFYIDPKKLYRSDQSTVMDSIARTLTHQAAARPLQTTFDDLRRQKIRLQFANNPHEELEQARRELGVYKEELDLARIEAQLAREEVVALSNEKNVYDGLLLDAQEKLNKTSSENTELLIQVVDLAQRLETAQTGQSFNQTASAQYAPENVTDAIKIFKETYPGSPVVVLRGAQEKNIDEYRDPTLILNALNWLQTSYFAAKIRGKNNLEESAKRSIDCEFIPHQSIISKGKYKEEYQATYEGRKIDCSAHLRKGKHGDSMIRIGFGWDEQTKTVVVNYIGRHQTNTKS